MAQKMTDLTASYIYEFQMSSGVLFPVFAMLWLVGSRESDCEHLQGQISYPMQTTPMT
jgi:hypothetical protein